MDRWTFWAVGAGAMVAGYILLQRTEKPVGSQHMAGSAENPHRSTQRSTEPTERGDVPPHRLSRIAQPVQQQPEGTVQLTAAELEVERKDALRRRGQQFQDALEKEVTDAEWSKEYESVIISFFRERQGNTLETIECRSTLCRAVIRHDSTTARQEFSESLGSEPFTGGSYYYPAEEGSFGSIIYLGRPGMQFGLPRETKVSENSNKGR